MRDSNYKSITNNRAAVTITTSLYDRRALDVTSDKPLVNSLNHLTYLVSSLAKVRETLSMDGGIERLIEILHECHNLTFNVVDNIFNSERKLLTAWKWTLAFQCLVLIGTRGTEKVRLRVVQAGMLPIIATVLDNYLTIHERSFIYANGDHFTTSQPLLTQPQPPHSLGHSGAHQHHHAHQQRQPALGYLGQQPQQQQQQQQQQQTQGHQHQHQLNRGQTMQPQHHQQLPGQMPLNHFNQQNVTPRNTPAQTMQNLHQNIPQQLPLAGQPQQQTQEDPRNHDHGAFPEVISHVSIPELEPSTLSNARSSPNSTTLPSGSLDHFNSSLSHLDSYTQNQQSSSFFSGGQNLTSDDYDNLSVEQLFKLIKLNSSPRARIDNDSERQDMMSINNDVRRRYLIVNIIQKLRREKENDVLDCSCYNECDYEMDCDLQFLSDMYLQEEQSSSNYSNFVMSKIAPRNFTETGVVIPRDDDIVWSLQLLAYISKYPYLKNDLQNTHLVIDMSIRDKQVKLYLEKQLKTKLRKNFLIESRPKAKPKSRKNNNNNNNVSKRDTYVERFRLSPSNSPQMLNDIKDLDEETFVLDDEFGKEQSNGDENGNGNGNGNDNNNNDNNGNNGIIEDSNGTQSRNTSAAGLYDDEDLDEQSSDSLLLCGDEDEGATGTTTNATGSGPDSGAPKIASTLLNCGTCSDLTETLLQALHNDIVKAQSVSDELERKISLFHVGEVINRTVEVERKQLSEAIMNKREEKLKYLTGRWDYDSYENFDIDSKTQEEDLDFDDSLVEYKKANLFPMVEKFTFLAGTDMYYWAGVIMRNSCRRNEAKGGVRQCGNLECGKWESYPREFLKCRRCKRTKYCSRECQMRAWQCHRNWCIQSTSSSGTAMSSSTTSGAPVPVHAQEPMRVDVMTRPPVGPS